MSQSSGLHNSRQSLAMDPGDKKKAKAVLSRLLNGRRRQPCQVPDPEANTAADTEAPKSSVEVGVELFNREPEAGVQYFLDGRCGPSLSTLPGVARLLAQRHGVDRAVLGCFLGTSGSSLLNAVWGTLNFEFRDIDMSLRQLFYVIHLPKDPKAVDTLLHGFARKFFKECSDSVFASVDGVYAMALAIVRLNANLRQGERVGQFVRQLSGMNAGDHFPPEILEDIRDAISEDEIRDREDDPFPEALHRRWLMMRSARGKSRRKRVVLERSRMLIMRTHSVTETKYIVPYETISSVSLSDSKSRAGFRVSAEGREMVFGTSSELVAERWVAKLEHILAAATTRMAEAAAQSEAASLKSAQKLEALLIKRGSIDKSVVLPLLNTLARSSLLSNGMLHLAIGRGDIELLTIMLDGGAHPDSLREGVPAIGAAAKVSDSSFVETLLKAGADATVAWEAGGRQWTPLLAACYTGRKRNVQILLECGQLEDGDVNFMVEAGWLAARQTPTLSRGKTIVDLAKASRVALTQIQLQQSVMQFARQQVEHNELQEADDDIEEHLEDKVIAELESKWKTILQVTTDCEIKQLLQQYGAKPASGLIQSWLLDQAKRSMDALCRRLASLPRNGHPVILVPGYCCSVLECWESAKRPEWVSTRMWISIGQMTASALKNGSATNDWLQHLMLNEDLSDPEGIRVRPGQGLHAVDYLVGGVGREASYVYGHIIRAFKAAGHSPKNLTAFAYDWRLAPSKLEERDGAFTMLQSQIEAFVRINRKRVVLIGHSMGNMFVHYFLFWAQKHLSQEWITQHVRLFVAMGAPWAGSPKVVRCLNTGDAVGLEMLLTYLEAVAFCRRNASLGWLYPAMTDPKLESCMYVSDDKALAPRAIALENALDHVGTFKKMLEDVYDSDDLHGGSRPGHSLPTRLRAPPVEELLCVYGTNLPTEIGAVYKTLRKPQFNKYGDDLHFKLDMSKKRGKAVVQNMNGVVFKSGLLQEVPWEDADGKERRSGDGTVPWESLTYYKNWIGQEGAPRIRQFVVDGAEHRDMLGMPDIIGGLLSRLAMLS